MKIIDTSVDADTRALLNTVLGEVWREAQRDLPTLDELSLHAELAMRLISAAQDGERDRDRLKSFVMRGLMKKRARAPGGEERWGRINVAALTSRARRLRALPVCRRACQDRG